MDSCEYCADPAVGTDENGNFVCAMCADDAECAGQVVTYWEPDD